MRYWKQKEYIGIGLGSASFIDGKRFSNSSDFKAYVLSKGNAPKEECISLGRKELMDEFMMLGFRMTAGPDFTEFNNKFGELPAVVYQDVLEKLKEKGLIDVVYNAGEITACFLTDKGLDLANIVFEEFV
jgi:oxygen-independent coproporphyrinogen-3 oxidase